MENRNNTQDGLINSAHGIEAMLVDLFEKFPHIPEGGRKVIADIAPWLALISGVFGLLSLLTAGGLTVLLAIPQLVGGSMAVIIGFITVALGLIATIFQLLAFNPLKERAKKGWNLLFYSALIGVISVLVSFIGSMMSMSAYGRASGLSALIGAAIGALIGGWLLFEIRKEFRN